MSDSIRDMLAREAAEAEARADAEERGEVEPARGQRGRRAAADPSQVYAVRIPASRLRELRRVADQMGVPPTTLIREWVIERLDGLHAETGPSTTVAVKPEPLAAGEVRLGRRRRRDMPPDRSPYELERRRA